MGGSPSEEGQHFPWATPESSSETDSRIFFQAFQALAELWRFTSYNGYNEPRCWLLSTFQGSHPHIFFIPGKPPLEMPGRLP